MKIIYSLLFIVLINSQYTIYAQIDNEFYTKSFTPKQLREDWQQYKSVLQTLHPSLYWYTDTATLEKMMNAVNSQLDKSMSEFEFYQLVAPVTTKINCGHTGSIPSYQARRTLTNRFPLEFRYIGDKLYLFYDYESKTYPLREVTAINGNSISEILDKISSFKGTDGFIQTPKSLFFNNSSSFGYNYNLAYKEESYQITFSDGSKKKYLPILSDSLTNISKFLYPTSPIITHTIQAEDSLAILSIQTFDKYPFKKANIKYKKYLADFFKKIQKLKVKSLIIDLRENGGGEDNYASLLYRYLTDQPFQYYKQMELNPLPYDEAITKQVNLPTEVRNGFVRKFFIKKEGDRFFVKPTFRTKGLRKQAPKANSFNGKLYFLISGKTYSAAAELISYSQAYRPNTLFVGVEAGGTIQGNTSAIFAFLTLKHTNIGTYIPLVRYSMNITNYAEGRGVRPDYEKVDSLTALRDGKDEIMNFTIGLVKKDDSQ